MIVHRATLHDFRQHRELDVSFSGFTGIIGANGSGKTNLLASVRDVLNLNSTFSCGKNDLVTWGSKTGSAEVEFSAGRADEHFIANLTVGGRNAGRTVRDMQGNVIAATADATVEFLSGLFGGADQAVVDALSFAKQAEILQVLFQRGSVKGRLAQRIVGAAQAGRIHSLASEALETIPPLDVEAVRSSLQWIRTNREAWRVRRNDLERTCMQAVDLPDLESLSARISRKTAASGAEGRLAEIESELVSARTELHYLRESISGIVAQLGGKTSAKIKEAAEKAETYETAARDSEAKAQEAEVLREQIRIEGGGGTEGERVEILKAELDLLAVNSPMSALIPAMREHGSCPACLRDGLTPEMVDRLEDLGRESSERTKDVRAEIRALEADVRQKASQLSRLSERLHQAETHASHKVAAGPAPKVSASRLWRAHALCMDLEVKLSNAEGQEKAIEGRISRLENRKAGEVLPGPEDRTSIENLIGMRDRVLAAGTAEAAIVAGDLEEDARVAEEGRLIAALETERNNRETRALLSGLKSIMAYDQAPLAYASARLGEVSEGINRILETLGCPFRVSAGAEFDFSFTKNGGRTWAPADFLSGGEKAALVLAFRIEISRFRAGGIRLVAMDEPTVWIEEAVKANFPLVLASMKNRSDAEGIQFLVSTHDREVLSCFDSVIEL